MKEGVERERKENSGHPLFLAADRSILQSIKQEFRKFALQNARIQLRPSPPEKTTSFDLSFFQLNPPSAE